MCIICELGENWRTGDRFLEQFAAARESMKAAAEAMLECSRTATTEVARRRYDRSHKSMVRLIRDWNRLEEARENHAKANG